MYNILPSILINCGLISSVFICVCVLIVWVCMCVCVRVCLLLIAIVRYVWMLIVIVWTVCVDAYFLLCDGMYA